MVDLKRIKNSGLHDYEVVEMAVEYSKSKVKILLKTPKNEEYKLCVEDFVLAEITHEEVWGKGKYVVSSDIECEDSNLGIWVLLLELNSGDKIVIKYKS